MGQPKNATLNKRIQLESNIYKDILQEDFNDSYRNLTLKGIMSLKWASKYCSNIKYFIKTDDDIIIDIFLLVNHLKSFQKMNQHSKKTIFCAHIEHRSMPVIRSPTSRWYLSEKEYGPDW